MGLPFHKSCRRRGRLSQFGRPQGKDARHHVFWSHWSNHSWGWDWGCENSRDSWSPIENVPLLVVSTEPSRPLKWLPEMPASEVPPPIEADMTKHTATRNVLTKTTQDEAASSEVTITISIFAGNNWNILNPANIFSISVANSKKFCRCSREIVSLMMSKPKQEENIISPVIDPLLLSLAHQSVIQQ